MKRNGLRLLSVLLSLGMLLSGCGANDAKTAEEKKVTKAGVSVTGEATTEEAAEELGTETLETEGEEGTEEGEDGAASEESSTGTKETASNDSIVQNSASYSSGDKTGGSANPYNYASSSNAASLAKGVVNSIITSGMSDLEKAKAIHDWMVMNLDYDYQNYLNGTIPSTSWKVEGVLTTKYAICEGYARTFIALCNEAGLDSLYVMGKVSAGLHAWNQVKIDGVWYNVDVCWDDPANRAFNDHSTNSYKYFLISDAEMNKDHKAQTTKNACSSSLKEKVLQMHCPWRDYNYATSLEQMAATAETYVASNASTMVFHVDPNFQGSTNIFDLVKKAIGKCNVVDDYEIASISYTTDNWGIKNYTCKLNLKNGVFTRFNLVSSEEALKQEILKLSTNSAETQYVFVTSSFLESSNYLNLDSFRYWLYFDAGLVMNADTFTPISDGIYKAHIVGLRPATSSDEFIQNAYSYSDVEAIVADRAARGITNFTVRYHYDTSTMTTDEAYAHLISEQKGIWAANYGMSVEVSSQTTDTCFVFFKPAQ